MEPHTEQEDALLGHYSSHAYSLLWWAWKGMGMGVYIKHSSWKHAFDTAAQGPYAAHVKSDLFCQGLFVIFILFGKGTVAGVTKESLDKEALAGRRVFRAEGGSWVCFCLQKSGRGKISYMKI